MRLCINCSRMIGVRHIKIELDADYVRQPFDLKTMRAFPRYLALISLDPAKYVAMTNVG